MIEMKNHSVRYGTYTFSKSRTHLITPNIRLTKIKILDATPHFIRSYTLSEDQVLLATLRYNRLIDTFLGITCYSVQSHVQVTVRGVGRTETDEIYIGLNEKWRPFVIPITARKRKERIRTSQIERDMSVCEAKFPALMCRPVAAQFIESDLIALFEFVRSEGMISIKEERHYRIVPNEMLSDEEIKSYGKE